MGEGLRLTHSVRSQVESAIKENYKAAGIDVSEISLPSLPTALAVYYIICPAGVRRLKPPGRSPGDAAVHGLLLLEL
jgi:hypothetical protein